MHRSLATTALLVSAYQVSWALGVVGRMIPPEVIDVTNGALHHNAYVDARIRLNPHDMLNHEKYHQRNVDPNVEAQAFNGPPASSHSPSIASSSDPPSSPVLSAATDSTVESPSVTASPLAVASPSSVPAKRFTHLSKAVVAMDPNMAWTNQTDIACMQTLTALNGSASNAAGLAACYNVRTFDNATGAFQVDLRLYRICPATGDWATLKTQAVNVGLSYTGASVAAGSMNKAKRDGQVLSWPSVKRDATVTPPRMLQDMTFVGKIHEDQMAGINNEYVTSASQHSSSQLTCDYSTTARTLLVPNIALTGTAQNNTPIATQLSSNDASFVSGTFADQTRAATAPAASTSVVASGATPFVLPGTTLGIFPIGLIITSIWTLLLVGTVGYGTFGRIRFRESYRRRIKARLNAGVRTI